MAADHRLASPANDVGADHASTTAVNVYLEDPSSGPIDVDFDIVFFC